jgi:hypothetical protein
MSSLKNVLHGTTAADSEDATATAELLNSALVALYPEAKAPSSVYFRLFRRIDECGRGLIEYNDFVDMVRIALSISTRTVNDRELRAFWVVADPSRTGTCSLGSFVNLMKRGSRGFNGAQEKLRRRQRPSWDGTSLAGSSAWQERESTLAERAAVHDAERQGKWASWQAECAEINKASRTPVRRRRARRRPLE